MTETYISAVESSFRKRLDTPSSVINFKSQSVNNSLLCKKATSNFDSGEFIAVMVSSSPQKCFCNVCTWKLWYLIIFRVKFTHYYPAHMHMLMCVNQQGVS